MPQELRLPEDLELEDRLLHPRPAVHRELDRLPVLIAVDAALGEEAIGDALVDPGGGARGARRG